MGKKKVSRTDILRICLDIEKLLDISINYDDDNVDDLKQKIFLVKTKLKEVIDNI